MKILITGATGTIGSNAVRYFTERGYAVRAQVRPNSTQLYKIEPYDPELAMVDLRDRDQFGALVKGVDAILHLGAQVPKGDPSNYDYFDINVDSTFALLESARNSNGNLERFVFASSCCTYRFEGWNDRLITEEDKWPRPVSMYQASKNLAETVVNTFCGLYGFPAVILTIPETVCGREILGERRKQLSPFIADKIEVLQDMPCSEERNTAIHELQGHLRKGKRLVIPLGPDGIPWRQHLGDVRDVVRACELAIRIPGAIGQTFVIMSDALDYGIGVPHLAGISGMEYTEAYIPGGDQYWFDMDKSKELLQYTSDYNSARILEDAWRHFNGEDIGIVDGTDYPQVPRVL